MNHLRAQEGQGSARQSYKRAGAMRCVRQGEEVEVHLPGDQARLVEATDTQLGHYGNGRTLSLLQLLVASHGQGCHPSRSEVPAMRQAERTGYRSEA